ncbi:MAG: 16S rRNA (guanine(966)-N(2))-methyltransferase RsmD [Clostridia bacterium]|nr:16S rRNA (guanine(966)-N(2))-methyltransferase RsmD [Clostridia bacterium]
MRVISGTARGKQLLPVPGVKTRPTTDRVKESIFNIIQMRCRGARVLDLFAGTGQLGIEALSRGATHADFVDMDKSARAIIEKNLRGTRVEDRAKVYGGDFTAFLAQAKPHSYDIIFLDPPYGGRLLQNALHAIERFDILSADGIIICESAVEDKWETGFSHGKEYRYGGILITLLHPAEET